MRAAGLEPRTHSLKGCCAPVATRARSRTCDKSPQALGAALGAFAPEICPDLAAVVAAWPGLPEALKAGIVAMVKAAK